MSCVFLEHKCAHIEDLPLFVVGYDFYPRSCVFSIETHYELDKTNIQPQTIGNSIYHMLQLHHFYLYITFQ